MACSRKAEREAKKARVLEKRKKDPNMTVAELARYFGVPQPTVRDWIAASGLGQTRTEDRRGILPSRGG
ncbi:hypothetical protein [Myxococcus phage Mx4 ts27htf-1hrm-1]|nr:hypothetical protein Mx4_p41 [Myxococcus phage Mx4]WNM70380.1 hypothetical protein [Myxococcus phage Mx4 ts27htf-1hrm-1]